MRVRDYPRGMLEDGLHRVSSALAGGGTGSSRHARGLRRAALAAFVLASGVLACRPGNAPPQHYEDPQAMIAVFEDSSRDAWQLPDRVVRALPIASKDATIADIGAGSGYFSRRLALEVPSGKVYAVDVDTEFEQYLLANREGWGTPNIEPHLAHYEDPLLPAGSLDLVFSANTYAFIRDRVAYFTKVRALLKPQGRVVVIDFRPDSQVPNSAAPEPRFRVSRDLAIDELNQSGLVLEREETFLPQQWFLILKAKP